MKNCVFLKKLFALLLTLAVIFAFVACNPDDTENDDGYVLTLSGLVDGEGNVLPDVNVTKAQIKALYAEKPVNYTDDNPCYASDKTDDNGNKIPHSLKGVYLEDALEKYTGSAAIDVYGSLTLSAADGYVTVATEEIFNSAGRGSKMIIAFEYDGITLSPSESSGALRAVFPDQIANCWAKKLNKVEFSTDILQTPSVMSFTVLETLEGFEGSYRGTAVLGGATVGCDYFGISLASLIEEGVLSAQTSDKMHLSAWDYNFETNSYSEYSAWTKYNVFAGGWLLYERQVEGYDREMLTRIPVFDGPEFSAGMTVKNILALSVFNSAVVSFETAFTRFDLREDGEFKIKDLLVLLNMYDSDESYVVTPVSGEAAELSASEIWAATVTKEGGNYVLSYGAKTVTVASVSIKI